MLDKLPGRLRGSLPTIKQFEAEHVIVDECHHLPAFSFERVLAEVKPGS